MAKLLELAEDAREGGGVLVETLTGPGALGEGVARFEEAMLRRMASARSSTKGGWLVVEGCWAVTAIDGGLSVAVLLGNESVGLGLSRKLQEVFD